MHTTEWLLREVHTDTTVDISQCHETLIDALESFRILNSNAKLPPQLFVGCIWWQIESIKAETKQNSYTLTKIRTDLIRPVSSTLCLQDLDPHLSRFQIPRGIPHEMPTSNPQDILAASRTQRRSAHSNRLVFNARHHQP